MVGGIIADRTQNYHRTIQWGLIIMALGYVGMAIPLFSQDAQGIIADGNGKWWGILIFTCVALLCIAFGNGLFKGNLQALVGQMYDDFEAEAAKKGPEALAVAKDKRDSGFQIFYVFINIGGVIAPFVAPMLREWWLKAHNFIYNADMSALCHQYLANGEVTQKFTETMANSVLPTANYGADLTQFCSDYILTFNQGVHFSFFVSVAAMLISLIIFFTQKNKFPQPAKKVAAETVGYTAEEKAAMAKEIKQRMAALFAVLGIAVFFWLSFHQNGQSLSVFARDFVDSVEHRSRNLAGFEPLVRHHSDPVGHGHLRFVGSQGQGRFYASQDCLRYGSRWLCLPLPDGVLHHEPLSFGRRVPCHGYGPDGRRWIAKAAPWVMIVTYFFLTVAELFISPLGLSFVSKVAPRHMVGLCQGLWLGATAIGNLFIFVGPIMLNAWDIWKCWGVFLLICLVSMSVMFGMVKWLERVTE